MKLSIVIPTYNCVDTIEQTLLSIFNQTYRDYELIVVDGLSSDGTQNILEKFSDRIDVLIREQDEGQYDAINKGFSCATGDLFAWINGDDIYMPGAFSTAATVFEKFPDVNWIIGQPAFINRKGELVRVDAKAASFPKEYICNGWYQEHLCGYLQQESMFWRKEVWEKCKGFDPELKLAADFELWTRFAKSNNLIQVLSPLAAFRFAPEIQRSVQFADEYVAEVNYVCQGLTPANRFWRWVSQQGQVARALLRMFLWKKSESIAYNRKIKDWKLISSFKSVSRRSFADLAIDFFAR